MITVSDALALVQFSPDEKRSLAKLEATIDATLFQKFDGAPLKLDLAPGDELSPKLAAALQRLYEARGGWRVNIQDARTLLFVPMFFTVPIAEAVAKAKKEPKLPAVMTGPAATLVMPAPGARLLVRMPTRARPEQALTVLQAYRDKAGLPITIEVVLDEDDATMLDARVMQRLVALGCVVTVGAYGGKVAAVNGGRWCDWDVLLLASDDMMPVADGYAVRVLAEMERHFPHLDGAIFFNDGYAEDRCCTLPILGRRLWEQFGQKVYDPAYRSLFCDNEQTEVLRARGALVYVPEVIIEHRHWVTGAAKDALYLRNDALKSTDRNTFDERKARVRPHAQVGFDQPPLWLSLLICSVPSRRAQLLRLLDHLWAQILPIHTRFQIPSGWRSDARMVEVLVDARPAPLTIGEKRQALLQRAHGHFVAFIDDDDWVAYDYVERIIDAILGAPEADCVALNGVMTTAGAVAEPFYNSIKYREWRSENGIHERTPTHLSPVRREHALKVGFPAQSHGEDHHYSMRLLPLLKKEVSAGDAPLYHYYYWPNKGPQA